MLIRERLYERKLPSRDAKLFVIYCEGEKREVQYFKYFREISSRINIEPISREEDEGNDPLSLFHKAESQILKTEGNPNPKYELRPGDQIWFVIDTDTWGDKITDLKTGCSNHKNWSIAQSNPLFEVWLYYHFFEEKPNPDEISKCKSWKAFLDAKIPGGFDSRKHPVYIGRAIQAAEKNFDHTDDNGLGVHSTEVYILAKEIDNIVHEEIVKALAMIEKNTT